MDHLHAWTRSVTDTLSVSGALDKLHAFGRSAADTLSVTGAFTVLRNIPRTVSDTLSISGSLDKLHAFGRSGGGHTLAIEAALDRLHAFGRDAIGSLSVTGVLAPLRPIYRRTATGNAVGDGCDGSHHGSGQAGG